MLRIEKIMPLYHLNCFDLKPPYTIAIAVESYSVGYSTLEFQKFDGRRGNTREHVVSFPPGSLCQRGGSMHDRVLKSLTYRAYIGYVYVNPRSMHDLETSSPCSIPNAFALKQKPL